MTDSSRRHQKGMSGKSAALFALLAVLGGFIVYIALLPGTNPPILEQPPTGAVITGTASGVTATFQWRHGFPTTDNSQPGRASSFVVCVLASGQQCALPGTFPAGDAREPAYRWTATADQIQRTAITAPAGTRSTVTYFWPLRPWLDQPYRYTFVPPAQFPTSIFGQDLRWTAGACRGSADSGCRYADARPIKFMGPVNLQAVGKVDRVFGNLFQVDATAKNTGSSESGEFKTEIRLWQLLLNSSAEVRTDVNNALFNDSTEVVLTDCRLITRGQMQPGDVVLGIHKPGGARIVEQDAHPGLPPGQSEISVAQILLNPIGDRPARFAISFTVDFDGQVPETDETDNTQCPRSQIVH